MDDWVDCHLEWVKQVTEIFLQKKRMSFEQFRLQWLPGSFPLNTPGILILARAYKIHVAVFFNNNFWTTDSHHGLERCTVFLLYRGSLVFDNSQRMTSEEFTEWKAYFKKLSKYYDKVHEDNDLKKLREHAKHENRTPKNYVPSDDEEITEVASVGKDTDTEEDSESSSGSSSGDESENNTAASKTDQADVVKDIMPTTEEDSEPSLKNQSAESDEEQHVSSAGMAFKCSECAKIRKLAGALNCKQCSRCAKQAQEMESKNIMPEKKDNTTSTSSEDLDLENMLNETVDKQEDTDFEQNKTTEDDTENNIVDSNVEQNVKKDVQSDDKSIVNNKNKDIDNENDVQSDGVPEKENKEINNKRKENTHAVVLRPCCVSLNKLNIANYKQQTVNKQTETEDKDTGDIVQQLKQNKQKKPAKWKNVSDIGKEIQNIMPNADDRYECPKRKCTRHYGTKRALHRHMLNNHSGNHRFHCIDKNDDGTDCLQSYPSQQLLDQHTRGVHGEGFIAYCGEAYTWPWQQNAHQKD